MENNPKLSIIVPIYNAEKYIDNCMRSIYAQSFSDYEIILVNDGSADNSAAICREYQKKDSRVTYIEKENGGAGSARNAGMDAARGEYLAFPDVDDSFEPEMYAELYALAESGDYDVVFSGVKYYTQLDDGSLSYSRTQNIKALTYTDRKQCRDNIMEFFPTTTIFDVPWNKLYKRSIVTENHIRFTDIRRCQDAVFNIDFFNCIDSAASLDKAYYHYMENTVADVQRKFPKNYIDITVFYYTHLIDTLSRWGVYEGDIKRHYDTSFVVSVYGAMKLFDNPLWGLSKEEQKRYVIDILNREDIGKRLTDASVRKDAAEMYTIIKNKDYNSFIKEYKKEKRKESIRQNKLLIGIYRKLRGIT